MRFAVREAGRWRSLVRWLTRRETVPAGSEGFGYHRETAPLIWTMVALSPVEILVVHLLLPWLAAQMVALVLGVYGALWLVSHLASLATRPHLLDDERLRVRHGLSLDLAVELDSIAAVRVRRRDVTGTRTVQLDGSTVHVVPGTQTNVDVELVAPVEFHHAGARVSVTELRIWADDPQRLAAAVRARVRP